MLRAKPSERLGTLPTTSCQRGSRPPRTSRSSNRRYLDAGLTVVCTFAVAGTHDGPLGPFPATGRQFRLPLCELWRFDPSGRVVGGDLYYDQVSLLSQLGVLPLPSAV